MNEPHDHDDLVRRLHSLGEQPVDPALASQHLTAMAVHRPLPERRRFGRLAVAGAAMAGFLFGGLGLGWANALPGPVQGVANEVLERVGPTGPWKENHGKCVKTAAQGEYADQAARKAAVKAAAKDCPKGNVNGAGTEGEGQGKPDKVKAHGDDPCKGGPDWAGTGVEPTQAQRDAFEAARAACHEGNEDAEVESESEASVEVQTETTEATTPTTEAPTTTTTESTTTTTEFTETVESSEATDTVESGS
jgi:hypothetical protein